MKHCRILISVALVAVFGCSKALAPAPVEDGLPIVFGVVADGVAVRSVSTAEDITGQGFTAAAVSEGRVLFNETAVRVEGESYFAPNAQRIRRYYFPLPPATTSFYACFPPVQPIDLDKSGNASLHYLQDGATDLLAAMLTGVVSSPGSVPLVFDHILSKAFVSCEVAASEDFTFTVTSVRIAVPQTACYSFESNYWEPQGEECLEEFLTDPVLLGGTTLTGEPRTFVPGSHAITVEWTVKHGDDYLGRFSRTLDGVEFEQGKVHAVNLTFSDKSINGFLFTITVNQWVDSSINLELES